MLKTIIHDSENGVIGDLACHLKILQYRYNNIAVKNEVRIGKFPKSVIISESIYDIEFTEDFEYTAGEGENLKYYTIRKGEFGNLINIDKEGMVTIFVCNPGERGIDFEMGIHELRKITNIDEVLKDL